MEVYKVPEFLIIHLKRFDHQRNSLFGGTRKLTDHVDFPVHGLNMTPFLVENKNKGGAPPLLYDLYAVSNQFGSLEGGHYTAFAKNGLYNKWFSFDDTDVSNCSEVQVVTKAAYVLFYRRR